MPTLRQPTSEFQRKNPGAKASPSISVQPAGSMRKQNMSCSPPYRPVAPLKPVGGGWKSVGDLLDHVQQVGVVQPGVAGGVDRAELAAQGEQLQGLLALRQRLGEHAGGRVRRQPIHRFLGDSREPAELAEAPVVHLVGSVVAGVEHQPLAGHRPGAERPGRLPDFQRLLFLPLEVLVEALPATGSVSSGVRRKSSCEARVRLVMDLLLVEHEG